MSGGPAGTRKHLPRASRRLLVISHSDRLEHLLTCIGASRPGAETIELIERSEARVYCTHEGSSHN